MASDTGWPRHFTKVYSILAYQKAMGSLQFGPGTAVAFSLTPVLAFFMIFLSRYMRRDVSQDDIEQDTWQDRVIDGLGWLLNTVGRVIAWPIVKIAEVIGSVIPKSKTSRQRSKHTGAFLRGIGLALLLFYYWPRFTGSSSLHSRAICKSVSVQVPIYLPRGHWSSSNGFSLRSRSGYGSAIRYLFQS